MSNFCTEVLEPVSAPAMDGEKWQRRAKDAGLSQRQLARLLGYTDFTVSRQLRGLTTDGEVPRHVIAAIIAWEMMTPEQREAWVARVDEGAR